MVNGTIACVFADGTTHVLNIMVPSGKRLHNYGKSPVSMGKSTISMVIFNSYVKLPEGNIRYYCGCFMALSLPRNPPFVSPTNSKESTRLRSATFTVCGVSIAGGLDNNFWNIIIIYIYIYICDYVYIYTYSYMDGWIIC